MTDPRYLVPLHLLPPVSGAPVAYMCTECGAAWTGEPTCSAYNPDASTVVTCLDLSAPDVVGGIPVRLDALGWALAVISQWCGARIDDIYELRAMSDGVWQVRDGGNYRTVLRETEPGYEEYDDLDPDQGRRILAAILRKGRPEVRS